MNNKIVIISFALLLALNCFAQMEEETAIPSAEKTILVENIDVTNSIELFPNPSVDYLMVHIENSTLKNVSFELRSIIGNKIEIDASEVEDDNFKIDLKGFATGYYFLVIVDEKARFKEAHKFLKIN